MVKKILLFALVALVLVFAGFFLGKIISANVVADNVQEITMKVGYSGYSPNVFTLKQGVPVRWIINVEALSGCNNRIVSSEYGIDQALVKGRNVIEFTPERTGTFGFNCWMNMLKGSFIVTESGEATQQQLSGAKPVSSGTCSMGANGGSCGCGGSR